MAPVLVDPDEHAPQGRRARQRQQHERSDHTRDVRAIRRSGYLAIRPKQAVCGIIGIAIRSYGPLRAWCYLSSGDGVRSEPRWILLDGVYRATRFRRVPARRARL